MTVEIVNRGQDKYEATCRECGCVFTYERNDVQRYRADGPAVCCPHCDTWVSHRGAAETKWGTR